MEQTETSGSDNDYETRGKNSGARKRQIMQSPNAGLIQHVEHVDHIHDDEYYRDNDGTQDQRDSGKYDSFVRLPYEQLEDDDSVIEIFDTEATQISRDNTIPQVQNDILWSYFTVNPLNTTYVHYSKTKTDRRISCTSFGKCKFVTSDSQRKTSTSNMGNHLKRKHALTDDDLKPTASKEATLKRLKKSNILSSLKLSNEMSVKSKLGESILDLFERHPIAFELIESDEFQQIFKDLKVTLPFKSRRTLQRKLMERGAGIEERVKELLASDDCTAIYIQLDLWQSPSDRFHYISVIGSFVDKEFQYREVMLGFSRFLGEHTGINMAHALFAVFKDYKIHSKLAGVTTDGATNNSVMMKRLALLLEEHYYQLPDDTLEMSKIFNENCWFHYLAHVLNLLSMELLKSNRDFTEPLMKIRKVTNIIRLSEVYRSKFIDICVRTKKSFTRPPGEAITRWNSTFLLLDWILDYKIELTEFLNANFRDASLDIRHKLIDLGSSHPQGIEMARDSDLCFTKIEWEMISLKRDILKPFMVFTEGFNQSTSTSSEALICYFYLYDYLKDLEQCSTKELTKSTFDKHGMCAKRTELPFGIRVAAGKAFKKLDGYMKRMDLVDMVYLSNVLNPRYKTIYLRANMERADCDYILQMCKDKVIKMDEILMKNMVRDTEHNTDQDTVSSSRMASAFEKIISSCLPESERLTRNMVNQEAYDSISGEWESYLNTDRSVNSTNDFLGYWKRQSKLYPRLAAVARVVYGFSSTSTSCERSFSLARNVIGHRRHRLAPLTLERMISSNFNFKVMKRSGMDVSAIIPITTHITEEDLEVSQIGTVEKSDLDLFKESVIYCELKV